MSGRGARASRAPAAADHQAPAAGAFEEAWGQTHPTNALLLGQTILRSYKSTVAKDGTLYDRAFKNLVEAVKAKGDVEFNEADVQEWKNRWNANNWGKIVARPVRSDTAEEGGGGRVSNKRSSLAIEKLIEGLKSGGGEQLTEEAIAALRALDADVHERIEG